MLPWQTGVVRRIEQAAPATRRYWIELPKTERFDFKPGQFVTLDLPIHDQRNKRWRSYSIASPPDGTNTIELVIVLMEGGLGSTHIFEHWTEGTEVSVRGPQGVFVLPESLEEDLFLICTGTGIAPFRAMLHHIRTEGLPHQNLHLIFGTRTRADVLYHDEMRALEKALPNLHYHPTLSRESWDGRTGYVHAVYEELCADRRPAQFMLCGWRVMVDEAKRRILEMGYDKKRVHLELYG